VYSLGKILWEAISGKMTRDNADPFKTAGLKRPATPFLKRVDDVIRHAKFGLGFVLRAHEGRIEVLFENGVKALVQGSGG